MKQTGLVTKVANKYLKLVFERTEAKNQEQINLGPLATQKDYDMAVARNQERHTGLFIVVDTGAKYDGDIKPFYKVRLPQYMVESAEKEGIDKPLFVREDDILEYYYESTEATPQAR